MALLGHLESADQSFKCPDFNRPLVKLKLLHGYDFSHGVVLSLNIDLEMCPNVSPPKFSIKTAAVHRLGV